MASSKWVKIPAALPTSLLNVMSNFAPSLCLLWSAQPGLQRCSRESIPSCLCLSLSLCEGRIFIATAGTNSDSGAQTQHTHGLCAAHMHPRPLPFSPMHTFRASYKASDLRTKAAHCTRGEWGERRGEVTALSQLTVCD